MTEGKREPQLMPNCQIAPQSWAQQHSSRDKISSSNIFTCALSRSESFELTPRDSSGLGRLWRSRTSPDESAQFGRKSAKDSPRPRLAATLPIPLRLLEFGMLQARRDVTSLRISAGHLAGGLRYIGPLVPLSVVARYILKSERLRGRLDRDSKAGVAIHADFHYSWHPFGHVDEGGYVPQHWSPYYDLALPLNSLNQLLLIRRIMTAHISGWAVKGNTPVKLQTC